MGWVTPRGPRAVAGPLGELLAELRAPSDAPKGDATSNSSELPTPPYSPH